MEHSESYSFGQTPPNDNERLIGMFAHLSLFFGSLILPLIFWATGKNSKFIAFHSLQVLFFHIAYTVILVFLIIFAAVIGMLAGLINRSGSTSHDIGVLQIIVILALGFVIIGFILACVVSAIMLSVSTYKGGMKKYPIIGNIVYKKVYGTT
jgi:uncharacterized Tic20 family protein